MKGTCEEEREFGSNGFPHGQAFSEVAGVCLYPRGSADAWLDGWHYGALKTDDVSYRDGLVTELATRLVWRNESWCLA